MTTLPSLSSFRHALLIAIAASFTLPSNAGIPVIDVTNIVQTTTTALEEVTQTAKQVQQYATQIQQYQTQIQQYQNMLQNTAAPVFQIWDQAQSTMNSLRSIIDTLSFYKQQLGSIDIYLSKFRDVNYYRNSPCFNGGICSDATRAAMLADQQAYQSESQKKANDALFKGLDKQQDAMQSDASTLQRLQLGAQNATGQMQALGFANQLASSQANQLLQIRGLLIAQQNAAATRAQALADDEAMRAAADAHARRGVNVSSQPRSYSF
jgi:P-type conjugative transfer protein TrbJ